MEKKEIFDQMVMELHKRYGGDKKRLESLKRMSYMDRDLDKDFLVENAKEIYGVSCTKYLQMEGILWEKYEIGKNKLNPSEVMLLVQEGDQQYRIIYDPYKELTRIADQISSIKNGGFPWDELSTCGPSMYQWEDVVECNKSINSWSKATFDEKRDYWACVSNKAIDDKLVGLEKLMKFVDFCIFLQNEDQLQKTIRFARKKTDGSLDAKKSSLLTWAGISIDTEFPTISLNCDQENVLQVKIKYISVNGRDVNKLKDLPTSRELYEEWSGE